MLWLHGFSLAQVARVILQFSGVALSADQVWGLVRNSPYAQRASMARSERQRHLTILSKHRMDGGRLPDSTFEAKVLMGSQR